MVHTECNGKQKLHVISFFFALLLLVNINIDISVINPHQLLIHMYIRDRVGDIMPAGHFIKTKMEATEVELRTS